MSDSLNTGDRAEIKGIAQDVVKESLHNHIIACPYGIMLAKSRIGFICICIGIGIGSGVGTGSIFLLLTKIFIK